MDRPIPDNGLDYAGLLRDGLDGDAPLYRLLADGLKRSIDAGEIPLGTMLPPERTLARRLAVSRSTVVAAYDLLKAQGWLESRQGSGTWVRTHEEGRDGLDAVATRRLFLDPSLGAASGAAAERDGDDDLAELSVAALEPSATVRHVLESISAADVAGLADDHGYLPGGAAVLRERVALRFAAAGLPTTAGQVVVTNGAHQAISLVARQVLTPGDAVLVESPTYPGALDVFRRFGARAVPLPVDTDGARTDLVADLIARTDARLVYVSPHFHSPTGAVMPEARRRELAAIADRTGTVVIEDLAMGDVAIDEVDLPTPIAAHARRDTVHTVGSTSKLFWAGLRTGWVRSPEPWYARMLSTKTVADLGTSPLNQLLAARMLEHEHQVRDERRTQLRERRDAMIGLLAELLPDWTCNRPAGGLSLWTRLPRGNADEFTEAAYRHGVSVIPGSALSVDSGNRRYLRLVFAPDLDTIDRGVRRLAGAWASYSPDAPHPARLLV